jgi:surfeit locus 1 family protein
MGLTIRLGIWQLDRLQQRRQHNTELVERINAPPLEMDGSMLPFNPEDVRDRLARSEGRFDYSEQIVLVQQNFEGRPGAHLVAPFLIGGSDNAVLVDRGWIPAHEVEVGDFSRFDDPGQKSVLGSMQMSQTLSRGRKTEVEGRQQEWYRIDIEAIQNQMRYQLLPIYLLEKPPAEIQELLPLKVEVDLDLTEGAHLGYAIQWFLFSMILAVGYVYLVKTRTYSSNSS